MDYEGSIIPYMKGYVGLTLKSLSGRSDISISAVDELGITMTCSDGQTFFESHRRPKIAFRKLLDEQVIHVDAALENSGTRRNVPETLIANLPFVEYGKINNRQHLFFRDTHSHPLGTIKRHE
ncbi:hypothetical protein [Vibrio sp. PNB22_1_1]